MKVIALIISLFFVTPLKAEVQTSSSRLPIGTRINTGDEIYQGYTLEEMKILLKMETDLRTYEDERPKLLKLVTQNAIIIGSLQEQLSSRGHEINLLEHERQRLTKKWTITNKKLHECENKPPYGSWIAWGIAATSVITATVFGVVLFTQD